MKSTRTRLGNNAFLVEKSAKRKKAFLACFAAARLKSNELHALTAPGNRVSDHPNEGGVWGGWRRSREEWSLVPPARGEVTNEVETKQAIAV